MSNTTPRPVERTGEAITNTYDEVLYVGHPHAQTHPDRLAPLARLHGVEAAPVDTCRVLEIGCGDGANIVPMAATLPSAEFTGIDYAARPVARAQKMVEELGIANVRIAQLDLRDFPADAGSFDYIIAHGLYSWLPLEVRQHLMPLIARHLAPNGIAYVSYNVFPGCRVRQAAWDVLKFHTRDCHDLKSKLAAARALIPLMIDSDGPVSRGEDTLRAEFRKLAGRPDALLGHDDLSDQNNPVYFHEFVADAARSGLTFVAETDMFTMTAGDFMPHVRDALEQMDRLTREQYLDFFRFRPFRCSLICHANALPDFELRPDRILGMHALPSQTVRVMTANGKVVRYQNDDAPGLMNILMERWPDCVPVAELAAWHSALKPRAGVAFDASLSFETLMVELCIAGAVEVRTRPQAVATVAGERPVAFGPARWVCRDSEIVPNLYHDGIHLGDAILRQLLQLLDGTRRRAELVTMLGDACSGPEGTEHLDAALAGLAQRALLVA